MYLQKNRALVHVIALSRKIFQRMKNYVTYRIACTIQLLLFFFISVLMFHPDSCEFPHFVPAESGVCQYQQERNAVVGTEVVAPYFKLPVIALVLITILNDGTIISIAYDNVVASKKPENWNLPRIYWISTTLGLVAVASSLVLLYWGLDSWSSDGVLASYGIGNLPYDQVMMMMYLKISLSDFMTVFSARTTGFFFTRAPGRLLFWAAIFATFVSTLLSIFWPFTEMEAIPFKLAVFVWLYCTAWFFIQDLSKVFITYLIDTMMVEEEAKDYTKVETQRQNRIRMGTSFVSSDSILRDSFVAGRSISSRGVAPMNLEKALDRLERLEAEMKVLRQVIQGASSRS